MGRELEICIGCQLDSYGCAHRACFAPVSSVFVQTPSQCSGFTRREILNSVHSLHWGRLQSRAPVSNSVSLFLDKRPAKRTYARALIVYTQGVRASQFCRDAFFGLRNVNG